MYKPSQLPLWNLLFNLNNNTSVEDFISITDLIPKISEFNLHDDKPVLFIGLTYDVSAPNFIRYICAFLEKGKQDVFFELLSHLEYEEFLKVFPDSYIFTNAQIISPIKNKHHVFFMLHDDIVSMNYNNWREQWQRR